MNQTFDSIKYGAKLAGFAALSFLKINLTGAVSTGIASAIVITVLLYQGAGSGHGAAHVNGQAAIIVFFLARPVASILSLYIIVASPALLLAFGNKYIITKTAYRLVQDKGESILYPLIDGVLNKINQQQPEIVRTGGEKLRQRIISGVNESPDNKWTKRITTYGLKKAQLDDVNFADENLGFIEIIKIRIFTALKNISKPSRSFFWIILGLQWVVLFVIVLKIV